MWTSREAEGKRYVHARERENERERGKEPIQANPANELEREREQPGAALPTLAEARA